MRSLGCNHINTTAYHPASNGLVERFHRQLKAASRANGDSYWVEALPLILLGIRATVKEDLQCGPTELVFGAPLRLPGEMIVQNPSPIPDMSGYATRLRSYMQRLTPAPPRRVDQPHHVSPNLRNCPFVFIRVDKVRPPLQPPYDGSYRVLDGQDKYFVIDINGFKEKVSIDRLRVAYLDDKIQTPSSTQEPTIPPTPQPTSATITENTTTLTNSPTSILKKTRSGRTIRQPLRFADVTH